MGKYKNFPNKELTQKLAIEKSIPLKLENKRSGKHGFVTRKRKYTRDLFGSSLFRQTSSSDALRFAWWWRCDSVPLSPFLSVSSPFFPLSAPRLLPTFTSPLAVVCYESVGNLCAEKNSRSRCPVSD